MKEVATKEVATFYRYVGLTDPASLAGLLERWAREQGLKGTVLVAAEGLNGTLAGSGSGLRRWLDELRADPRFDDLAVRFSSAAEANPVFLRLKVRVKDEIVALRRPDLDPGHRTGQHVDAATWNRLLDDPQVTVIDTRNSYEIAVGTFPRALDPGTRSFREFPDFVSTLAAEDHPRVAMFCTGGVRCEKASAYLLEAGFSEVYQLDGGILNYLDKAGDDNRFDGECFVFDQRVSVTDRLDQGDYVQCHACRRALSNEDLSSPDYREGVSCGYCHDQLSEQQRAGFAERRRQVELAEQRGELHVGAEMAGLRRGTNT
jgi:UPF0176 protein